ncbi:hypothetical protein L596_027368 [Steinernema carpocapsae]|uniref:Uncharacterized protein n=1 Tax=Steinernema carpocapsae TaxID=34508 RepID=A0A4U5M443_STECR|nr:hypothetical protein L596_027368 [Steinernema carpocapsae]
MKRTEDDRQEDRQVDNSLYLSRDLILDSDRVSEVDYDPIRYRINVDGKVEWSISGNTSWKKYLARSDSCISCTVQRN